MSLVTTRPRTNTTLRNSPARRRTVTISMCKSLACSDASVFYLCQRDRMLCKVVLRVV